MSGIYSSTTYTPASGDPLIDGLIEDTQWSGAITYSAPSDVWEYYDTASYGAGEHTGFFAVSGTMATAVAAILDTAWGSAAADGFSVEGFTNLSISAASGVGASVRVAQTTDDPYGYSTAWSYFPGGGAASGDVWFTSAGGYDYTNPVIGNYAWLTLVHELGHALGLEHGHEATDYGALPTEWDAMEFSVMTYKSYVGDPLVGGYSNETWGYAQTYMMLDIAALQYKYGANFSTNSGDTVYAWTPGSGDTLIDGAVALSPGANRIFATIWDGGGTDTYDLSAYSTGVQVDLAPGGASLFSAVQQANLGDGNYAAGNIYNALQYQGDARSLIENVIGGTGNDTIDGNDAGNEILGRFGNDTINGIGGADTIHGQRGNDKIDGGAGNDGLYGSYGDDTLRGDDDKDALYGGIGDDLLKGGQGTDLLVGDVGDDKAEGGSGADTIYGNAGRDDLWGGKGGDWIHGGGGDDTITGESGGDTLLGGSGDDEISGGDGYDAVLGGSGDDTLSGGAQNDTLTGGAGADTLTGGSGADIFVFETVSDSAIGADEDVITDFETGTDHVDLSALAAGLTLSIGGALTGSGPSARTAETGGGTMVFVDANGDGSSDLRVTLQGTTGVTEQDFLL
ncbi:M10 family metallopeptidase C-terminal domain-containing protein [Psychromarinibacter sp. S121]|uniref:M10 family metallopeptidase C-terminal domain-containing protein n=1 Tax=Psychromarinibacter sp. S121 TaxID=3415127 RepID=UPI003C7DA60A